MFFSLGKTRKYIGRGVPLPPPVLVKDQYISIFFFWRLPLRRSILFKLGRVQYRQIGFYHLRLSLNIGRSEKSEVRYNPKLVNLKFWFKTPCRWTPTFLRGERPSLFVLQFCCCMALIAATRAGGGLVYYKHILLSLLSLEKHECLF